MIQAQFDLLLAYVAAGVDDIVQAKQEYFTRTGGEVHEDDRCFESRLQAFFNWYLFDRKHDGVTPAQLWELERMSLQADRFKNVSIEAIYNFESPFLAARKSAHG